jgi:hypothetical protein
MVCSVHFNDEPTVPPNKTTNTTTKYKNDLKHKAEMKNYENRKSVINTVMCVKDKVVVIAYSLT